MQSTAALDWNFWPILGIFGEVWKCVKWTISIYFCKSYLDLFLTFYHWHSDFMLHHHIFRDCFVTVLRIFAASFVRALPAKYDIARTQSEVELRKILAFGQACANENRLCQVFRSRMCALMQLLLKINVTSSLFYCNKNYNMFVFCVLFIAFITSSFIEDQRCLFCLPNMNKL